MKRDMNLVRQILFFIEEGKDNSIAGYEIQVILFHADILIEAGYLSGKVTKSIDGRRVGSLQNMEITWSGYEFLDSVRDQNVWDKTTNLVSKVKSVSFHVLKEIVAEVAKKQMGL